MTSPRWTHRLAKDGATRRARRSSPGLCGLLALCLTACAPGPARTAGNAQPLPVLTAPTIKAQATAPLWATSAAASTATSTATPYRFEVPDGAPLSGRAWLHPQAQHIILGVHGFNDYSHAFEPLARTLGAERLTSVYAFDQRGFGANPEPGRWLGTERLLADLRHIVQQLRAQHPGLPITVVGESMGGALVWTAANTSPGLVADQIVLQAPAVWGASSMPWYQRLGLQLMNAVVPDMTFTGRGVQFLGISPTDDPEVSRSFSRDPLFIKATRVSSLAGVTELMGRAQNLRPSSHQRSLVLYGLNDRIIPARPVCDWLAQMNTDPTAKAPDFVIYPSGWHLLTRQLDTQEVLQDLRLWLDQQPMARLHNAAQAQQAVCAPR